MFSAFIVKMFTMLVQRISMLTFGEWHQTQSPPEANGNLIRFWCVKYYWSFKEETVVLEDHPELLKVILKGL